MPPDLAERAERVRVIAEDVAHGKVLSREGESMVIEVPADIAPGLATLWGMGGFIPIYIGQDTRLAKQRVRNADGYTVVCENEITTAFYRYRIDLAPRAVHVGETQAQVAGLTAIKSSGDS